GFDLREDLDDAALDGLGELDHVAVEAGGDVAQVVRARILGLVDVVAEAHDAASGLEFAADPVVDVVDRADGVERVERAGGGAAVERAGERADAAHQGRADVGSGGGDDAAGEGGGVEAVVDGEDQVVLDGAGVGLG